MGNYRTSSVRYHSRLTSGLTEIVVIMLAAMVLFAFVGLIVAIPVYLLWNWLMPEIFELGEITYWQAWGLFWLASLLTKGGSSKSSSNS